MRARLFALVLLTACDPASTLPDGGATSDVPDAPSAPPDATPDLGLDAPSDAAAPADGGTPHTCSDAELAALEAEMTSTLAAAATSGTITDDADYTLVLEAPDGRRFVAEHGTVTARTELESASTSKWISAVVILDLVDRGVLSLETRPHDLIPFWTETEVTLRDLLSFTSGFSDQPRCQNQPTADFEACVREVFEADRATAPAPGTVYQYSSAHLQIAGLMAIYATGASGWAEIFDAFKARTGLFPTSRYDLPSLTNPRLAGGMTWTAEEYDDFLRALYHGELLTEATRAAMYANQRGTATLRDSPAWSGMSEDWSYGLGNWLECRTATELGSYDCGPGERNSSAGAYGSYPFIDRDEGFFGILARQGMLGTGDDGTRLFRTIEVRAAAWANRACR